MSLATFRKFMLSWYELRVLVCSDDDVENDPSQKVDDAEEEDDGEREAKWRMERLEREKFLEGHQVVTVLRLE